MTLLVTDTEALDPHQQHRPSVLVPRSYLKESDDLDDGDTVEIRIDDGDALTCFVVWGFDNEPDQGTCHVTQSVYNALHTESDQFSLSITPTEPPEADWVRMSQLLTGGITMEMRSVPPEKEEEMADQIQDEIEGENLLYVGQRFSAESEAPDGVYTASRFVREIEPPLVARKVDDTSVAEGP